MTVAIQATKEALTPLELLRERCVSLGAEVRYCPQRGYSTAMVWNEPGAPSDEERALDIQRTIQQESAQYPEIVCYRFDPYSTLLYLI